MVAGRKYWVRQNHAPRKREIAFCSEYYPWMGRYTKVKVDCEYEKYYVLTVLPKMTIWGKSRPYKVTVQKVDISTGNIIVKGDSN